MRIFVPRHLRPLISPAFICLATALVLSSCSKKPEQEIIGKWNVEGQAGTVEFRKDGTVLSLTQGQESSSTYKFLSETNLEMATTAEIGTNKILIRVPATIAFHDGDADLLVEVPQQAGAAPKPMMLHLHRAK